MAKQGIAYDTYFQQVNKILGLRGLLLAAGAPDKPTNAMAIGWAGMGLSWNQPTWTVFVRPSRFTYQLIEETGEFSVNVPGADVADAVAYCGSHSGRDEDKLAKLGLSVVPGRKIGCGVIEASPIIYECKVIGKVDVLPELLSERVKATAYPQGDYHRLYFGQVLAAYADRKIADLL